MNDIDFKLTLIKAVELDKTLVLGKEKLISILSKSNIYIEYTSLFTYKEWNTYCAILHIQAPVDKFEDIKLKEKYIFDLDTKIFGKQDEHYLTDIEVGIVIQSHDVIDFSTVSITDMLAKAIDDAEAFMKEGKYTSAFDRVHTAFHGYLRKKLDDLGETYEESDTLNQLYNKLHTYISNNMSGDIATLIKTTLRSASGIISSTNDLRNRHSLSHPNIDLISNREAKLCITIIKTLSDYIEQVI